MKSFQTGGWVALIFGILVLVFPDLLNTLVGIFLVVIGINFLWLGRNH